MVIVGVVTTSGAIAFASWWLTAPLTDRVVPIGLTNEIRSTHARSEKQARPVWPEGRLAGEPAKHLLLDILLDAADRLDAIDGYTATFHKQERLDGTLGPVQTLAMKTRHHPFAIYFKFIAPSAGKEVVYAEGHHDNKVIAHSGGVARLLVPRLALEPTHPLALAGSRHAVTEAGLANLTGRLIHYRQLDLKEPEAVTILDRITDDSGKSWLRSIHSHDTYSESRPFARVEVLYDPATFFPLDIRSYDWPKPGQKGELLLAEHYSYENLDVSATLTAIDFDPANPEYAFHR
jgi:hypothetical protein